MKKRYLFAGLLVMALVLVAVTSWEVLSKLDLMTVPGRATYQLPDRVIEALDLEPGATVADIGAGDGYFVFPLADAVGPTGRVYAVEVEEDKVNKLKERVREKGYSNVEVVLGEFADPLLPDGAIDLVFLCNTYHHIDDREAYFSRLRADLRPDGRVALIDVRAVQKGIARWLTHRDHATPIGQMYREMERAGYLRSAGFDFLAVQNFEIFSMLQPKNESPEPSSPEEQEGSAGV